MMELRTGPMQPAYRYRAGLVRVIDGDTYELDVDLGFHVHKHVNVRLRGAFCPELREKGGPDAAVYAMSKLSQGREIVVESYKDHQSFARWVCDVWVDGVLLADILAAAGHVTERTGGDDVPSA